jgi:hypothetical protein
LVLQLGVLVLALQYLPAPSLSVAVAVLAAVLLYRLFLARRPRAAEDRNSLVTKIVLSINEGFVLLGVAVLAALAQLTEPVYAAFGLLLAFAWLIVRGTTGFLTESIGDVQVYTTRNPNSPNFAIRGEILADAEAVFHTIANRKYESIVIVGHSLGAVVALEAVQGLRNRIPDLQGRIKGFVTVGAALEKVKYFFGQDASAETRGLEAAIEETIQGPTTAERDLSRAVRLAVGKPWLNLWYWNDVVADPIFSFGRPEDQPRYGWRDVKDRVRETLHESSHKRVVNVRFGTAAMWSHSRYWGDRRTLNIIAQAANHWT